jgi:hypothetical protein
MAGVMAYIEAHADDVEREYGQVVQKAEETRRYWEEQNRDRAAQAQALPATPDRAALRAKLQAWKDQISRE